MMLYFAWGDGLIMTSRLAICTVELVRVRTRVPTDRWGQYWVGAYTVWHLLICWVGWWDTTRADALAGSLFAAATVVRLAY